MRKLFSINLLLLIVFQITFAQDISTTKSEIFKDEKKNSFLSFTLEEDNGGIITIREYRNSFGFKLKGYYIQHFDSNLKLINELDYEVEDNVIKNAIIKDGQLHLIEIEQNSKEKKIAIQVSSSDINDFSFSKKELISFSEDNVKDYFGILLFPFLINNGFSQIDGDHMGDIVFSANKKFFAVNFDFKNEDKETHKVFVFDDSFEKVYEKLIEKDIKDRLFDYNDFEVDGVDGTIYFLGKSFEKNSRKSKKDGEVNYHFELNKINAETEETISFKSQDKFINSLHLLRNKNKLVCVGFYGNDKESKINGVCIYDLNAENLNINFSKFNDFSDEFLTDKYGDKENRKETKKEKGINNIDFKGVYLMANNDILVNAEEFFITTYTNMGTNGSIQTHTVYHFNDIIALKLDQNGVLKWARNINKAQTGFTTSSFTSLPIDTSTYYFINCSDTVKKLDDTRISFMQTSSKKSNLYIISIDENGHFGYKKLIDDKDSKVYYKVNDGVINIDNQTVFLLGEKKKDGQILKLKVN